MEKLANSCARAPEYPKNLVHRTTYDYDLVAYYERLNARETALFWGDWGAFVDFWESEHEQSANQGFLHTRISNVDDLHKHLQGGARKNGSGPRCRFMFVNAPHSRDRLKISRKMFTTVLSFQQVFPEFLDFVFPFGNQRYPEDLLFSGFREQNSLAGDFEALSIPELGRSGEEIQMCYTLKSPEPLIGQDVFPWSIRQMSVFHSFDVELGHAEWIVIKGNKLIQDRLMSAASNLGLPNTDIYNSVDESYIGTIRVHLLLSHWASENWRWYIKFLEDEFQRFTRRILDTSAGGESGDSLQQEQSFPDRQPTPGVLAAPKVSPMRHVIKRLNPFSKVDSCTTSTVADTTSDNTEFQWEPPPEESRSSCNLSDLREVQYIGEKANEVSAILQANAAVLSRLRTHYFSDACLGSSTRNHACKPRLSKRLHDLQCELECQQLRANALTRSVVDRKSLLSSILEFRSIEASRLIAKQSQESTENMRDITTNMQRIAQKTKQETVSMRIITLVTLLYLPSTFISTMMSTDIIKFRSDGSGKSTRVVHQGAFQFYMAICLPLTLATFVAWYGVYWCVVCRDKRDGDAHSAPVGRRRRRGWPRSQHLKDQLSAV